MKRYIIDNFFDENDSNVFRELGPTDEDITRFTRWGIIHNNDREIAKSTFGVMHFEWDPTDDPGLPKPDFCASNLVFSQRAIDVLRYQLEKFGDIYPIVMTTGEPYYLFNCWSWFEFTSASIKSPLSVKQTTSVSMHKGTILTDIFQIKGLPGLVIDEPFKRVCEEANLTGMLFSDVDIDFTDEQFDEKIKLNDKVHYYPC